MIIMKAKLMTCATARCGPFEIRFLLQRVPPITSFRLRHFRSFDPTRGEPQETRAILCKNEKGFRLLDAFGIDPLPREEPGSCPICW